MALTMTRPTKRDDCSTFQFKRRTPKALLRVRRGERITFRFPDAQHGHIEVGTKIGEVVKFSLRTREPHVAKLRCALAGEQLERMTLGLAIGPRRLTQREIIGLSGELYREMVASWEDEPAALSPGFTAPGLASSAWRVLHDAIRDSDGPDLERLAGPPVNRMLDRKGIVIDSDCRSRLIGAVRDAFRDAAALLAMRAEGDYSPDPNAARFPSLDEPRPSSSLTQLLLDWKAEAASVGTSEATTTKYERIFARFIAFLGHDDARAVRTQDVLRYKDHRLREDGASPKTIKDGDLAALKLIFAWGLSNSRLPANPAKGVTLKVVKNKKKGYSNEAATAILRAAQSREPRRGESARFTAAMKWGPLLCAHSGARVGEIAQIRKSDIKQRDGVWIIVLTPDAGPIKNRRSREVPLHPQIVQLGFLQFVSQAPPGYLFLDLTDPSEFLARHRTLKNRLGDFARSVVREDGVPGNHGWRHAFITRCRAHGVDQEKRRMIVGHVGQGTDEAEYGDAAGLYEEIRKLPDYDLGE